MKLRTILIVLLALAMTVFAITHSVTTLRIARKASEDQLKSTAYFVGVTLDQALNRIGIDPDLFLDVIRRQPWEAIAFIALYDLKGEILLHSSKRLIGTTVEEQRFERISEKKKPRASYIELKTGETVYVMDFPLHVHGQEPSLHLLRIALHPYPARRPLEQARIHMITSGIFLATFWILALTYLRYSRKLDVLLHEEAERKHLVMLGEMSAVLAHEIRSPLSAIKGFAQYATEKGGTDPKVAEALDVIVVESDRLEQLTNDLLVYAGGGESKTQQVSLRDLMADVLGLLVWDEDRIEVKNEIAEGHDIQLMVDGDKLRRVLINVIQNAIDAIEKTGEIVLSGGASGRELALVVRDTGSGMDAETLEQMRTPFYTSKARGTGLGMAIVEKLLKVLKGSLRIESVPGEGTTVHIFVPGVKR